MPIPASCGCPLRAPITMATNGIIVSGIAVPTAARTLPTAPSARSSRCPIHSTPFVNSSAPRRISASEAMSRIASMRTAYRVTRATAVDTARTAKTPRATAAWRRSPSRR